MQSSSLAVPLGVFFLGLFLIVGKERDGIETVNDHLNRARTLAMGHIKRLPKGTMIVFDFDDTLFDPHTVIGYRHAGKREFWHGERRALPLYRPLQPICDVLKFAVAQGMYVTLITARPDTISTKQIILQNFKHQHMQLHELHCNPDYPQNNNFKALLRRKIHTFRPIGLTIGDQWTDVNECDYHYIKLPNTKEPMLHTTLVST